MTRSDASDHGATLLLGGRSRASTLIAPPEPREARERRAPRQSVRREGGGWRRVQPPVARLVIADTQIATRHSVRRLLEAAGLEVVGEAADGAHAARLVCALKPDLAILDVALSELDGFDATRQIARRSPGTKVILLSSHGESRHVREGLAAGAVGYVVKDRASRELIEAIRRVLRGQIYLCTSAWLEPVPLRRREDRPGPLVPIP
jgi:CheY-like chemotaxis protein